MAIGEECRWSTAGQAAVAVPIALRPTAVCTHCVQYTHADSSGIPWDTRLSGPNGRQELRSRDPESREPQIGDSEPSDPGFGPPDPGFGPPDPDLSLVSYAGTPDLALQTLILASRGLETPKWGLPIYTFARARGLSSFGFHRLVPDRSDFKTGPGNSGKISSPN